MRLAKKLEKEVLQVYESFWNSLLQADIEALATRFADEFRQIGAIESEVGMLQHSRSSSGEKIPTDINVLAGEYLRLAYHGFRAKDESPPGRQAEFNAEYELELDSNLPKVHVVRHDVGRILLNLINNEFHAVKDVDNPKVLASTRRVASPLGVWGENEQHQGRIQITISDNGPGIPEDIKDQIFHPFFTNKPTVEGTGLGLSLSYDIIKAHSGEIKVVSDEQTGTEFRITLPT